MRTNTTKAKLADGKVVYGAIVSRFAPDTVEIFGAIGYDFVMIDCEHGPMDLDQVEHMVRAAESFGITPHRAHTEPRGFHHSEVLGPGRAGNNRAPHQHPRGR